MQELSATNLYQLANTNNIKATNISSCKPNTKALAPINIFFWFFSFWTRTRIRSRSLLFYFYMMVLAQALTNIRHMKLSDWCNKAVAVLHSGDSVLPDTFSVVVQSGVSWLASVFLTPLVIGWLFSKHSAAGACLRLIKEQSDASSRLDEGGGRRREG